MNLKNTLFAVTATLAFGTLSAQDKEAKIDDGKVLLDGKTILKYEKININEHSFYTNDDDEVINFQYKDNETPKYADDDYFVINFINEKTRIESTNTSRVIAGLGLNSRKNMTKLVNWLLKEKVLTTDGALNADKVATFSQKYNEDVTQRTVR